MKTTIIPAQITTVEDKIVGSLGITQMLILMIPVISGSLIYAYVPTAMSLSITKGILFGVISLFCVILILRVEEKLVAQWLILIMRYNQRSKFYVFNKNSLVSRNEALAEIVEEQSVTVEVISSKVTPSVVKNSFSLESILSAKKLNASFVPNRKGGLYVAIK